MNAKAFADAQRLHRVGDFVAALRIYDSMLRSNPREARARIYRALAYAQLRRVQDALADLEKAGIDLVKPNAIDLSTMGIAYRMLGRFREAELSFSKALVEEPQNGPVKSNLGLVLMQQGRLDEAQALFEQAAELVRTDPAPLLNLARLRLLKRDYEGCEKYLASAEDRDPSHSELRLMRAELHLSEANNVEAFNSLIQLLKLEPTHLGGWLLLSRLDETAVDSKALKAVIEGVTIAKPTSARFLSAVVGFQRRLLIWDYLEELEARLSDNLEANRDLVTDSSACFMLLSANVSQRAHLNAAKASWRALSPKVMGERPPLLENPARRKLRVGYLSSDLRDHAIGYLIVGVLENHDHHRFEWFAYYNEAYDNGEIQRRVERSVDRFVNVSRLDDHMLAERIRSDRIDVLVDLNQITQGTRSRVFAYQPAPVAVNWLGMPGSLGAGGLVDYIVMDSSTFHRGNSEGFDEKVVVLEGSYQPNDPVRPNLSGRKTRDDFGIPEDVVVFCSFNQTQKFSPETIAAWSVIFSKCQNAVLWLLATSEKTQERFLALLSDEGIDASRVIFAPRLNHEAHLNRLSHADLMLDNWPYNAHTTCSDALRVGVPVLTLPKDTFASRVAAGILRASSLDHWIAESTDEYVEKAVNYYRLTKEERERTKASVFQRYWDGLMPDSGRFARRMEAFYTKAAELRYDGLPPRNLHVSIDAYVSQLSDTAEEREATEDTGYGKPEIDSGSNPKNEQIVASSIKLTADRSFDDFQKLLGIDPPLVIDIGAAAIDQTIGFEDLADKGLVRILMFEPSESAYLDLIQQARPNRLIMKDAIGDGQEHQLRLCRAPRMNSLLEPDFDTLDLFPGFKKWAEVISTEQIVTRRLDDIPEARQATLVKIDVQGFESVILGHAQETIKDACFIQFKGSPTPIYRGEASFFEVGSWLEKQGFRFHLFQQVNRRAFRPWTPDHQPFHALNHVFQVDAVFMPDPRAWGDMSSDRLRRLAYLAHYLYKSFDVALKALSIVDSREGTSNAISYRNSILKFH